MRSPGISRDTHESVGIEACSQVPEAPELHGADRRYRFALGGARGAQSLRVPPVKASRGCGGGAPAMFPTTDEPSRRELVDAWVEFLSRWEWDWFLTLTFRANVHPEAADKAFRLFVSQINRELFGPRWYKHRRGIRWVRALEMQRRDVIHYHALFGGAGLSDLRRLFWMDRWNEIAGYARIEEPRDVALVHGYVAKYVTKGGEIDLGGPLDPPPPSFFDTEPVPKTPDSESPPAEQ